MLEDFSTDGMDFARELGFKPGVVVVSSEPMFTAAELKAALFESTYSNPKTIPVKFDTNRVEHVAVDMVKAIHTKDELGTPGSYSETPELYVEGWYRSRDQRVRLVVVQSYFEGGVEAVDVQDIGKDEGVIYRVSVD